MEKKACYLLVDIARFVQVRPEHSSNKGHLKPKNEKEDWYKANVKKTENGRYIISFFTYLLLKITNKIDKISNEKECENFFSTNQ